MENTVSEIKIEYKNPVRYSERVRLDMPDKSAKFLLQIWDGIEIYEQFKCIYFDVSLNVLGYATISSGGSSIAVVDMRLLFSRALLANAKRIVIAHNHPSGSLIPSEADRRITKKIKKAGQIIEIEIVDHLILTSEGFYSFSNERCFRFNEMS